MKTTQLSPNLFVGAQIGPADLEHLAAAGFTDVVCNRPDGEHPEGPASRQLAASAAELRLAFHYLPIPPNAPIEEQALSLARLTSRDGVKVFAYCRSGARSAKAWNHAQAKQVGRERPMP